MGLLAVPNYGCAGPISPDSRLNGLTGRRNRDVPAVYLIFVYDDGDVVYGGFAAIVYGDGGDNVGCGGISGHFWSSFYPDGHYVARLLSRCKRRDRTRTGYYPVVWWLRHRKCRVMAQMPQKIRGLGSI